MSHNCSKSCPSDTFLLLIIVCVCVCVRVTRVCERDTQICEIVSGPRLVRIKRHVSAGKDPSSLSVRVCSRATHFIPAAKWVNRAGSVQLPPHCRGVRAGVACGGTRVCGAHWICLNVHRFECQFVSTAVPKKREKN